MAQALEPNGMSPRLFRETHFWEKHIPFRRVDGESQHRGPSATSFHRASESSLSATSFLLGKSQSQESMVSATSNVETMETFCHRSDSEYQTPYKDPGPKGEPTRPVCVSTGASYLASTTTHGYQQLPGLAFLSLLQSGNKGWRKRGGFQSMVLRTGHLLLPGQEHAPCPLHCHPGGRQTS